MSSLKIEQDSSNYLLQEKLGEGTFGTVYKAIEISSGRIVALKRTKIEDFKEGISAVNLREICFLKSLRHQNIVTLNSIVFNPKGLDLIFEFMVCDLRGYIDQYTNNAIIPEQLVKKFLVHILTALHFCHSNRVIHRDLKPQNLLLDKQLNLKVADFGLARSFQFPMRPYTPCVQTLWYRAPEVLFGTEAYSTAIDIWSVGCIFSEMLTKEPLFPGSSEKDVAFQIFNRLGTPSEQDWPDLKNCELFSQNFPIYTKVPIKDLYPALSVEGVDLLSRMINIDPDFRISALDALNHVIYI